MSTRLLSTSMSPFLRDHPRPRCARARPYAPPRRLRYSGHACRRQAPGRGLVWFRAPVWGIGDPRFDSGRPDAVWEAARRALLAFAATRGVGPGGATPRNPPLWGFAPHSTPSGVRFALAGAGRSWR